MLFNSLQFLFFFPTVTAAYFLLPHRLRPYLLLAASCVFYAAFIPSYLLILVFTILVDYYAALLIEGARGPARLRYLWLSVAANVGALSFFKYFNFFSGSLAALASAAGFNYPPLILEIILPVGLSFHTFQAMSYTIEVYRGAQQAERNPLIFALYVLFYPQLVAGPIERPQHLLPQFREEHRFDYERAASGLRLMAWGLFKKVMIADRLAPMVNSVYAEPALYSQGALITATVAFAFQIYCDFSGYSDIAVGSARVMGFRLMRNFDSPYSAASISDFWKRWHISLSSWFRDYLYIPLGGNRAGATRRAMNLMATFLVSGLWHGANWTFVVWGALNGLYLVLSSLTVSLRRAALEFTGLSSRPALLAPLRVLLTFSLTCAAWVFFRASTITEALDILRRALLPGAADGAAPLPAAQQELFISAAAVLLMETVQLLHRRGKLGWLLQSAPAPLRWTAYSGFVLALLVFGVFSGDSFIYFQF